MGQYAQRLVSAPVGLHQPRFLLRTLPYGDPPEGQATGHDLEGRVIRKAHWAAAFALAGCADPSVAMGSRQLGEASLWESVERGQIESWRDRMVTLHGYASAEALGSVALLRKPPMKDEEGNPDYDPARCIGLMVIPEQYRSLQRNGRVKISGKFSAIDIRRQDAIVTHIQVKARRIYPFCISAGGIASYIFVEKAEILSAPRSED